jgi:hypothetical protein
VKFLQGVGKAFASRQIIRQRPLNRIEITRQCFARRLAFDGGALGCELLFGVGNLRLHLGERIGAAVAGHRAGGDGGLQLRASFVVRIEIGFEVVALEL